MSLTDDDLAELSTYSAHRYEITLLTSGTFVLLDHGEIVASGTWESLAGMVQTGAALYESCADTWRSFGRPSSAANQLLLDLGLIKPTAPPPPVRRI